jgi:hypothetical protein
MTVLKEMSKYKFELRGLQEVISSRSGTEPAGNINFSVEKVMGIMNWV